MRFGRDALQWKEAHFPPGTSSIKRRRRSVHARARDRGGAPAAATVVHVQLLRQSLLLSSSHSLYSSMMFTAAPALLVRLPEAAGRSISNAVKFTQAPFSM
jgi:hypothetical protein